MGYLSDVAIAVTKNTYEKMKEATNGDQKLLNFVTSFPDFYLSNVKSEGYEYIVLHWKYVKWYDAFPEVQLITEFLKGLDPENPEEQYDYVRIGEDRDDLEYHFGIYDEQILDIERSVQIVID